VHRDEGDQQKNSLYGKLGVPSGATKRAMSLFEAAALGLG
jgi:hypothetical protein